MSKNAFKDEALMLAVFHCMLDAAVPAYCLIHFLQGLAVLLKLP